MRAKKFTSSPNSKAFLPTSQIIKMAKDAGVDFGPGDPAERIRYFIKLGILPHMVRKIPSIPASQHPSIPASQTVGHLPQSSLKTLIEVNRLFASGLSYPQIAKIKNKKENAISTKKSAQVAKAVGQPIAKATRQINIFTRIGTDEKILASQLDRFHAKIQETVEKKLSQLDIASQPIGTNFTEFAAGKKSRSIGLAATAIFTIALLTSSGIYLAYRYHIQDKTAKKASEQAAANQTLGSVLAASSASHKLYVDADSQFSGTTVFLEDITAPNVLYGAVGGTGINVSAGQTPTISLDSTGVVTSVNTLAGGLTISGSGATSISASGSTITISSTAGSGDITAVTAGNGLSGGGSSGDVSLAVALTSSGTTTTTSSASGLQFSSGLTLLRGCSNSQTLAWVSATATWDCTAGGGFTSFTLSGDTGTDQTISDANTLEVAGGTNGIDTVGTATDTITLNLDTTEIGTTTFGTGSGITWTFDAGATDPTLAFASGQITFGATTLVLSGTTTITASSLTTITGAATAIDFTEFDVSASTGSITINDTADAGNISIEGTVLDINSLDFAAAGTITTTGAGTDMTLNPVDEVIFGDTNTFIIGGHAGGVAYNVISDAGGTPGSASVASDDDLYIEGFVEIDGGLQVDSTITGATGISSSGTITLSGLTASRFVTTDASSNLATTGTSADLATTLSNETGTGFAVFATSPTITTSLVTDSTTFALVNTTATTINFAGAATTALNIGNGNTAYTAINIGSGTGGNIINIAGTGATGADTINIGTGGTSADTITIGNNASSTSIALTTGTGSQTFTSSVASGTAFSFVANSVTSGNALTVSSTGTTTGEIIDLTGTWAPTDGSTNEAIDINITHSPTTSFDNFQSINLTTTDGTALPNTVYGLSNTLTLTSNATKVGFGNAVSITTNSATGDTLYGNYTLITPSLASSSGNKTHYGTWSRVDNDGVTDTGAATIYGGYFDTLGNTGGINSVGYGVYTSTSGADLNYGLYALANDTATSSTNYFAVYGLYLDDDPNTVVSTNYGVFGAVSVTASDDVTATAYGIVGSVTKTGDISSTPTTLNYYGGYFPVSTLPNAPVIGTPTLNSYGGYFSAAGNTQATSRLYGVYVATGSGTSAADTNYGAYLTTTDPAAAANTNYGIYNLLTHTGNAAKVGFGTYSSVTSNSTTADTLYGGYLSTSATGNAARTANYGAIAYGATSSTTADSVYGLYGATVATGAVSSGTRNQYGLYGISTASGALTTATSNTYGGIFNAVVTAGTATEIAYGIYATASGGDQNIAAYLANRVHAGDGTQVFTGSQATLEVRGNVSLDGTSTCPVIASGGCHGIYSDPTANIGNPSFLSAVTGRANVSAAGIVTLTDAFAFYATNSIVGAGPDVITNNYGLLVEDMTTGTNDYGIAIAGADSAALWLSSGADNTGAADGITFGLSRDTNLYRSAANTLRTDDALTIGGVFTPQAVSSNVSGAIDATGNLIAGRSVGSLFDADGFTVDVGTERLCAGAFNIVGDCTGTPGDYSEYYATDGSTEPGDLVSIKPNNPLLAFRSQSPYDSTIFGIVSTSPNEIIGDDISKDENPQPVALAGRVPLKVNLENGPIKSGDKLTSSSTPGVAMKATKSGVIIALALEDYDGSVQISSGVKRVHDFMSLSDSQLQNIIATGKSLNLTDEEIQAEIEKFRKSPPPTPPENIGKIMVFVNRFESYNLQEALRDMDLEANSLMASSVKLTNGIVIGQNSVNEDGTLKEEIRDQVLTAEQVRQLVDVQLEEQVNTFNSQISDLNSQIASLRSQIDSPVPNPSSSTSEVGPGQQQENTSEVSSPEASSSSELANETQETLDQLDALLSSTDLSLSTLTLTGTANLAATYVAGTFSQDGTLIIDYGKQINVLGSTLYLQNDPLAGGRCNTSEVSQGQSLHTSEVCSAGILLDVGNGKLTLSKDGSLRLAGTLFAKSVTTEELSIVADSQNKAAVGSATISQGTNQITIQTTALKPDAKILITATTPIFGKTLYIASKSDFEGFTVAVDSGTAQNAINFDWFIVNTTTQANAI